MITVMIDIGHHENDSGAVHNGLKEVDFNLKVANLLVTHLKRCGLKVLVSSGSLSERVRLENKYKPDYFISIHTNSGGGDGSEVFCYKKGGIEEQIASNIIVEIVNRGVNNSRGVKEAGFYVLRKTLAPAVLVEMAFIDSKDIEAIDTDKEQDAMAQCIARGLLKTLKMPYVEETTQPPIKPPTEPTETLYRVCVGSYKNKQNALREIEKLKSKGINGFIHECKEGS